MSVGGVPEPTVTARKTNVRIEQGEAKRVLRRLEGMNVEEAHRALKFRPGLASAPLARVLEQGLAEAARFGIRSHEMEIGTWTVEEGDVITRLRRMAHGIADWITTTTTQVEIQLRVVGWHTGPPETHPENSPANDGKKVT